jgi:hypothetical protein
LANFSNPAEVTQEEARHQQQLVDARRAERQAHQRAANTAKQHKKPKTNATTSHDRTEPVASATLIEQAISEVNPTNEATLPPTRSGRMRKPIERFEAGQKK